MQFTTLTPQQLYEKDVNLKNSDVKIIQDWLKKQPHLPVLEESHIILFLHSCYYKIETVKAVIDAYFTRRTLYPEIFQCPSEDIIRKATSISFIGDLPKTTPEGYAIFAIKLMDFKLDNYNFLNSIILTHLATIQVLHKRGIVNGIVTILDAQGYSFGHFAKINLMVLKHTLDHIQDGLPVRIKHSHFVNTVPFMDKILAMIKPMLHGKLYNTIEVHSDINTLYKFVPKHCLPSDYGGDLPSFQELHSEQRKEFLDSMDFFKWHECSKVDESKRMEKSNLFNTGFGVDGTFKKLELD